MRGKRLLAWLLTLAMCFGEIGSTGLKVYAAGENETVTESDVDDDEQPDDSAGFEKTAENTMFGTKEMVLPKNVMQDGTVWRGSYAYFGEYQGEPVKYRVLLNQTQRYTDSYTNTVFLDCDNLLYTDSWSDIQTANEAMNSKLQFSTLEDGMIVRSYRSSHTIDPVNEHSAAFVYLHKDDYKDNDFGYSVKGSRIKKFKNGKAGAYWLRSYEEAGGTYGDLVTEAGEVINSKGYTKTVSVSPALNIRLDYVMFSSAVKGDKGEVGTEYKFTARFSGLPIKLADGKKAQIRGDEVSIPYTIYGDNSFYANAVTVLVLDKEYSYYGSKINFEPANILLYERLDIPGGFARNKTGIFKLPEGLSAEGWGSDYFVYILPEIINDGNKTDYAGWPEEIKQESLEIVKTYKVSFDTNGLGTAPDAQTVEKDRKAVKPDAPKASGYTFAGWYTNKACTGDAFDFDTPITSDITLYAKWVTATWTVSFDPNCSDAQEMPVQQTVLKGNAAVEPKDPKREGYAFGGWYYNAACEGKYDFSRPVNSNLTLYAKWKKLYEVSFEADGGTGSMTAVKIADGDYYTLPACGFTAPEKKYFGGWLNGSTLRQAGAAVQIKSDTVFTAYWRNLTYYTVCFHVGENKTEVEVLSGETVAKPDDPQNGDKVFLGWYTKGFVDNSAQEAYKYNFDDKVKKDLDLYAAWRDETKYHISVHTDLNGGGTVTLDKEYVMENEAVTVTVTPDEYFELDRLERVPYEDMGMIRPKDVKASEFSGNTYTFTFPHVNLYREHGGYEYFDSIMTAVFKPKAGHEHDLEKHPGKAATCTTSGNEAWAECKTCGHKYIWDEKNDTIGSDISGYWESYILIPASHKHVVMVEAKDPNCTVSGNLAYAVCKDCQTMWWNSNMGIEITMDDVLLPIDINAHEWDPATITYDWAEDFSTVTASCCCVHNSEHKYTEEASVTRTVIKEPDCEEDGIASYTSDAFTNPMFAAQTKTDVVIEKTGHDWQEPFYEWSADLSSVCATIECSRDVSHAINETVASTVKDMEGYKRYTAVFTKETFSEQVRDIAEVTFDMNGISAVDIPNIQKVDLNYPAVMPMVSPSAAGYSFTGWYCDEDCTKVYDFNTPITRKTVIYAGWLNESAAFFTVSFNMMEHGEAIAPVKVESGKKLPRPVDPEEAGMEFGGWYTEEECRNAYDFSAAVTQDLTLFAKWIGKVQPEPVKGGKSALDPLPDINTDTTDIYLVKGQKFDIPDGWSIARDDSVSKKIIKISSKGKFTAKKTGDAKIHYGNVTVNVHVYKPAIAKKTYKLEALDTLEIEIKDYPKDKMSVLWYSASPDVATVDENGKVKAVAKGSAKITAYINGSAYACTVKVSEKSVVPQNRTMHLTVAGSAKSIKVKVPGVKKLDWKSASENIATIKNNKVKAENPGVTVLTASANGLEYTIDLFAEDISLSSDYTGFAKAKGANKYTLKIKKGEKIRIAADASLDQDAVFKSSKPMVAFIDENGNVEARSKGSGKFTAKINGKTVTVSVKVEE